MSEMKIPEDLQAHYQKAKSCISECGPKSYCSSCTMAVIFIERIAALEAERDILVCNLAGCDTLALGYGDPDNYSKEMARPALDSVAALRKERDELRATIAERDRTIERLSAEKQNLFSALTFEGAEVVNRVTDRVLAARKDAR